MRFCPLPDRDSESQGSGCNLSSGLRGEIRPVFRGPLKGSVAALGLHVIGSTDTHRHTLAVEGPEDETKRREQCCYSVKVSKSSGKRLYIMCLNRTRMLGLRHKPILVGRWYRVGHYSAMIVHCVLNNGKQTSYALAHILTSHSLRPPGLAAVLLPPGSDLFPQLADARSFPR